MNEDTLRAAETWRTRGDAVALATLVRSRRSAPRPLGNKLAISARGEMAGSVSGGCVEGAVFEEAQSVLAGGPSKLLYYGIADDLAWNVGLTCGGEIWVWLEAYHGWPVPAERSARVTVVEGPEAGRHLLVTPEGRAAGDLDGDLVDAAIAAGQEAIERERNATVEASDALLFAEALVPPPRLVVVGAVDTAESLCRMAQRARLAHGRRRSARHVRDRRARAVGRPARRALARSGVRRARGRARGRGRRADARPEARRSRRSPRPSAATSASSARSARGAPRRSAPRGCARAASPTSELARVSGPVGLDIGAHTPEETAVSILAEVIASRSGRDGGRLISGSGGIHAIDESLEARVPSPEC